MLAKEMFPPESGDPRGTFAATWRETISGAETDDGHARRFRRGVRIWCCTGIGEPTATVGLDPTGRETYAADGYDADAKEAGAERSRN